MALELLVHGDRVAFSWLVLMCHFVVRIELLVPRASLEDTADMSSSIFDAGPSSAGLGVPMLGHL